MIPLICALSLIAFVAIVVNERLGNGVPLAWLGLQVVSFLVGLYIISTAKVMPGLAILLVSDLAGLVGFATLWSTGARHFTKPIFPGMKD